PKLNNNGSITEAHIPPQNCAIVTVPSVEPRILLVTLIDFPYPLVKVTRDN
ncbi:hypothetical protein J6590_104066, partial [Homalodisca vitripennis]